MPWVNGKSGLPLLQDLPLIGSLFGTTASNTNRTELVVLITPRVVRTTQDMREIGQDFKDRMKVLYPPVPVATPPSPNGEIVTPQPGPAKP